jgi:hypothetical protein
LFVQFAGTKEVDKRKLSDHQSDDGKKKATASILDSDDSPKTVEPEQFRPKNIGGWNRESIWTFDMQPHIIQPCSSFRDFRLEQKLVAAMKENLMRHLRHRISTPTVTPSNWRARSINPPRFTRLRRPPVLVRILGSDIGPPKKPELTVQN